MNPAKFRAFILLAYLLLCSLVLAQTNFTAAEYSVHYPSALGYYKSYPELPFKALREMCWTEDRGFCDPIFLRPDPPESHRIWVIFNHDYGLLGEIYEVEDRCYLWLYAPDSPLEPHVAYHSWVECSYSLP